ncbi:MAG: LLM class flavin-dependent oxidoreductase [Chloroflexi bacterium]|nr:LLM class flavin-dependent oxidoreductase [Chloroflexota bacterium]
MQYGLLLNNGIFDGVDEGQALALTVETAELAEVLGYHELWVTEHHFIEYGICPSAITLAGFLLGRTSRIRVGTAVTLAPLVHPVALAEQTALNDQLSGGRFDLGLGRGGYELDYQVFGISPTRWTAEIEATLEAVIDALSHDETRSTNDFFPYDTVSVRPRPRTRPHPPIYVASTAPDSLKAAAHNRLPLQFHYHLPSARARAEIADQYQGFAEQAGWDGAADHVHTVICFVDDDEAAARQRLTEGLLHSWRTGAHANFNSMKEFAEPLSEPEERAAQIVNQSPVGPPDIVAGWLEEFTRATGATKLALYMEADGDPERVLTSVRRFAGEVMPRVAGQGPP